APFYFQKTRCGFKSALRPSKLLNFQCQAEFSVSVAAASEELVCGESCLAAITLPVNTPF
ncbi:hypothetical protein, partial [Teichococcus deserti]|uniref:hypothetical protein n=1 Tax=Teichococcus deserti TaxID=1817963 RepID=UPI001A959F03